MNCNRPSLAIRRPSSLGAIARAALTAACVGSLCLAQVARAESGPKNVELYNSVVRQAVEQYERGNYEQAKVLFAQAHHVFPNARTLRGLGMVAYAMRDYVEATQYLESAIMSRVKPLEAALETDTRDLLARARGFTGLVHVRATPEDASIKVNGAPARRMVDQTLRLNPGQYEIEASAPGYQSATHLLRIEPGTTLNVDFNLAHAPDPSLAAVKPEAAAEAPGPQLPAAAERSADHSGKTITPWIVAGASAAVAIAGGVMLGIALRDVSEVEHSGPTTDWSKVQGKYDRSPVLSGVGIALIGVGAAGVAAGLTWHLLEPDEADEVALDVSPLGVRLHGAW
jgi:hypothetical protein